MEESIKKIILLIIVISITITNSFLAQLLPKPGSDDWKKLTIELRREACNIPDVELKTLSTDELLERCLDYQFMSDVLFTNEFKGGLDAIAQSFNGLREFFERNDAVLAIIKYYDQLNPSKIENIESSVEKGEYIFKFVFLELYMTQSVILKQLIGDEKIIIKKVLEKTNACIKVNLDEDKYVYSMMALKVKGLLISVLLNNIKDSSLNNLRNKYPECSNAIDYLRISDISDGLFYDLLKRASEL